MGLGLLLTAGLSGCEMPELGMSPNLPTAAAAESSPRTSAVEDDPAVSNAAATEPVRPPGDLDTGSLTHLLPAGDRTLVIDYWTSEDATTWTAGDTKTIQLSAHIEDDDADTVLTVTRFAATADDGISRSLATEDNGEFALTPPFSYSTAFTVPESDASAAAVILYVQFDLLAETEPGSERYYRQTVLDSIELPFAQEDVQ